MSKSKIGSEVRENRWEKDSENSFEKNKHKGKKEDQLSLSHPKLILD